VVEFIAATAVRAKAFGVRCQRQSGNRRGRRRSKNDRAIFGRKYCDRLRWDRVILKYYETCAFRTRVKAPSILRQKVVKLPAVLTLTIRHIRHKSSKK